MSIIDTIEAKGLRWYGHVKNIEDIRWAKKFSNTPHDNKEGEEEELEKKLSLQK